jgi:hypothetical protein
MARLKLSRHGAFAALICTAVAVPGAVALADVVSNNLDPTVDTSFEVMTLLEGGQAGTTKLQIIPVDNDGKLGCNITPGTSLSLSVNVADTSVAKVSPASVTFQSCDDAPELTVTPLAAGGPVDVTLGQIANTTGGSFSLAPARFRVVVAPDVPHNTPPTVKVVGVENRSEYEHDQVPTAGCLVSDPEDGLVDSPLAATPELSEITGPFAHSGLGLQTASCSYKDQGGLVTTVGSTYRIVDTDFVANDLDGDVDTAHEEVRLIAGGEHGGVNMLIYLRGDDPNGCNILPGTSVELSVNSSDDSIASVSPGSIKFTDCDQQIPIKVTPVGVGGPVEVFLGQIANDTAMKFSLATARFKVWVDPAPSDTTPPVINTPGQRTVNAVSPTGANVDYTVTAEDAGDPSPAIACTPPSGSRFAIGTTEVNCTATDDAGNIGRAKFIVKVKGAPEQIADLADKLRLIKSLAPMQTTMRAYLESAADCIIRKDKTRACSYADVFVVALKYAASRGWLTNAQTNDLIADVTRIKAVIGCGTR